MSSSKRHSLFRFPSSKRVVAENVKKNSKDLGLLLSLNKEPKGFGFTKIDLNYRGSKQMNVLVQRK